MRLLNALICSVFSSDLQLECDHVEEIFNPVNNCFQNLETEKSSFRVSSKMVSPLNTSIKLKIAEIRSLLNMALKKILSDMK